MNGIHFWRFVRRRGLTPSVLFAVLVVVLLVVAFAGYYEVTKNSTSSSTGFVTGTSLSSTNNTSVYSQCAISIGGLELRVLSDYTLLPVTGEKINAVDTLTITGATSSNGVARATVTVSPTTTAAPGQTVYLDNFSAGEGGWLTPIFPPQSCPAGNLNFTVSYKGAAYNFAAVVPPIGTACVTLHVPSGNVTTSTVMNGSGSYCGSQSSSSISQSTNGHNAITVSGLSLCPSNCVYPAPYVSASVLINASVPISSLTVYVNNTYDGVAFQNPSTTTIACTTGAGQTCSVELGGSGSSSGKSTTITKNYATCSVPPNSTSCSATYTGSVNTLTVFDYQYKGSVPSSFIPAVPGDTYVFNFVATFQDGSSATATASAVAG